MIGDKLRSRRIELNLTIQDVANYISVEKPTISRYENNVITNIPLDKLILLCKLLDISPNELFDFKSTSENKPTIFTKFNQLDEHGKLLVKSVLDIEFNRCIDKK